MYGHQINILKLVLYYTAYKTMALYPARGHPFFIGFKVMLLYIPFFRFRIILFVTKQAQVSANPFR